jgi:penicillin-binding protein 2
MLKGSELTEHERSRQRVIFFSIILAFFVIGSQLYRIQLGQNEEYTRRSRQNAMRTVPIEAVRGRILDRNGKIIVGNRPAYTLGVIPAEVSDTDHLDSIVSGSMDLPRGLLADKIDGRMHQHSPVYLRRDAPFSTIAYLEEHRHDLPSVLYMVESRRRYPYGELGAHFLGYVREVGETQLASKTDREYVRGDLVGQTGIEIRYEDRLRGTKGLEYQEVTAQGRVLQSIRQESVRGFDVRLSVDLDLQQIAESAMDTIRRGAVVAMDPNTGEILAMVSRPTFDPAVFSFVVPTDVWRQLNDNTERPMFNRATMGTYPPGSTAKMITAIAGLDSGLIDISTELDSCKGALRYGNRTFACWYWRGHGPLNVIEAIERSCNIFFYQLGRNMGIDRWGQTAQLFGIGSPTGVDLPGEENGLVASSALYTRKYGRWGWKRGEALNVAIGQGITLVTPLQMARYVSGLATGTLPTPRIAVGFIDPEGNDLPTDMPDLQPIGIDPERLAHIREAMVLVTEGNHGTARRSRVPGYQVAGKTGTAENPHGGDHSWYVGYVPADNPRIAVAVIAENAGHGSDIAAPIAGRIMRHFMLRHPIERKQKSETDQSVAVRR